MSKAEGRRNYKKTKPLGPDFSTVLEKLIDEKMENYRVANEHHPTARQEFAAVQNEMRSDLNENLSIYSNHCTQIRRKLRLSPVSWQFETFERVRAAMLKAIRPQKKPPYKEKLNDFWPGYPHKTIKAKAMQLFTERYNDKIELQTQGSEKQSAQAKDVLLQMQTVYSIQTSPYPQAKRNYLKLCRAFPYHKYPSCRCDEFYKVRPSTKTVVHAEPLTALIHEVAQKLKEQFQCEIS